MVAVMNKVGRPPIAPEIRFLQHVHPEPMSGCWLWTAGMGRGGYGKFAKVWNHSISAHRFSWEMHRGEIPAGMMVLHRCDNRACVNPDHLFLGDQDANMADMVNKKRSARHERNVKAKLTAADVEKIRARIPHESQQAIARDFGVNQATISEIKCGHTWRD